MDAPDRGPYVAPHDDIDQYGRGDYDPKTGLWEWYELPDDVVGRFKAKGEMVTWAAIFARWRLVLADLHQWYGVDLDDPGLVRSWAWLRDRVVGLLSEPRSRLARDVAATTTRR